MQLTLLARTDPSGEGSCGDGPCPSLYATDRGTYVIQGYRLDQQAIDSMSMPTDETAIEVPAGFVGLVSRMVK